MREIKFRGKTWEDKWVYGSLIDAGSKKFIWNKYPTEVNPETIGQSIGITDSNEKTIYEGDIVKFEEPEVTLENVTFPAPTDIALVKVEKFGVYFVFNPEDKFPLFVRPDEIDFQRILVIGNIHQNPELIERSHESNKKTT